MSTFKHPKLGEVRPSQLLFTYGVGALIDLPHLSVIVAGLDDWQVDGGVAHAITEERLLRTVQSQLGTQVQQLRSPPTIPAGASKLDPLSPLACIGVPVALFPRWMFCPRCQRLAPLSTGLFERRDDAYHPDRTHYVHTNCDAPKAGQPTVVPARFLVACPNGHLDDFPWIAFVHRGPTDCKARLRLIEFGPSGEARDLEVRCDTCNQRRRLADAFGEEGRTLMPHCRGRRPHLRDYAETPCPATATTILVGASNLWFPAVVTTLAIPSASLWLAQLVEDHWANLKMVSDPGVFTTIRQMTPNPFGAFIGYTDTEIWQAIAHKRDQEQAGIADDPADVKQPEWAIFSTPGQQLTSSDFRLREVEVPAGFENQIARVVLVERLREVRALIGFTRIDAPGEFGDSPAAAQERRVPLSHRPPAWVPAAEVRGEGIFIQFNEQAIQDWLAQVAAQQRADQFSDSHQRWRRSRGITPEAGNDPGMRYVLLHTFAHTLMRQFVLECGYTAASIRERLYARNVHESDLHPEPMAGVLIYTAAPDSEGTLGGLVSLGEPDHLRRHLRAALRDGSL
ncbi:MAG: DUF1998 domain-containing protein, partial [Chloroflexaceae bacterium]|nr:DUF1998 domain-containing protein [Chloroflexaceae bacterium]